ncbi:SapC family protein [Tateyamaria pelophila]|uniref:SapC family protein n=1 Tax=Tateyamaria pelophila TaxID=328415 RepID=UPI001CC1A758|nr:SapC family protein [Tateyamaria pelophila]
MSTYVPLNREQHDRLRLAQTRSYAPFRTVTSVPIILDEMTMAAREYPILFPEGEAQMPFVLMGMTPETNAFVDEAGNWLANYIPLDVRKYPFGLSATPAAASGAEAVAEDEGKTRYTLCIDPEAPDLEDLDGPLVFQPQGALCDGAKARADIAQRLLERSAITKALVQVLEDAGLLVPREISMNLGLEKRRLRGFRVVDEKKLNALSDEDFTNLRNKGGLPLVYAQLMSMANLRLGPLAGQRKSAPVDAGSDQPSSQDFDLSGFADDEDFDIFH